MDGKPKKEKLKKSLVKSKAEASPLLFRYLSYASSTLDSYIHSLYLFLLFVLSFLVLFSGFICIEIGILLYTLFFSNFLYRITSYFSSSPCLCVVDPNIMFIYMNPLDRSLLFSLVSFSPAFFIDISY